MSAGPNLEPRSPQHPTSPPPPCICHILIWNSQLRGKPFPCTLGAEVGGGSLCFPSLEKASSAAAPLLHLLPLLPAQPQSWSPAWSFNYISLWKDFSGGSTLGLSLSIQLEYWFHENVVNSKTEFSLFLENNLLLIWWIRILLKVCSNSSRVSFYPNQEIVLNLEEAHRLLKC